MAKVKDKRINEMSGMAASKKYASKNAGYVCNDENSPIFILNLKTGAVIGEFTLKGRTLVDPEWMFVDNCGFLWIGDTGNNALDRTTVYIYKLVEPSPKKHGALENTRYAVEYDDGKRNTECGYIDPITQIPYLVSKDNGYGRVYALPKDLKTSGVNVAKNTGKKGPELASDCTPTNSGKFNLLRNVNNTGHVLVYTRDWKYKEKLPVTNLPKPETITMNPTGKSFFYGTETKHFSGVGQDLLEASLPSKYR